MFKKTGVPFSDFAEAFRNIDYAWMGLSILIFLFSHAMRTLRWQMQLEATDEKATFKATFSAMMAGYLMNYGIPRSGEIIKCGLLSKHQKIPVAKVVGTAVADRIIDVLLFAIVVATAFVLQYDILIAYLEKNANFTFDFTKLGILAGIGILFIPISIPPLVFGVLYLAYEKYMEKRGGSNIAHDAHIWGAVFGFLFTLLFVPDAFMNFVAELLGVFS